MISHYKRILKDSEKRTEMFLKYQVMDKNSFDYGGLLQKDKNFVEPKATIYKMTTALALYQNKDSKYYENSEVYDRINLALDYVRRAQRPDGTFDLLSCNFFAAPDTAFCLKRMFPAYRLLKQLGDGDKKQVLIEKFEAIMRHGAHGIVNGGFHTPNHRWAISSVLMACYNRFGEIKFKETAMLYLNEGIDCNEDGEYAERSAGNYNRINNDAMIMLAEELRDEQYYEYVDRNLNMMFTYVEPDGSIFTNHSTRQDKGKKVYPRDYYFEYLYMAKKRNNLQYAAMAKSIMNSVFERGTKAPDCLNLLMLYPELIKYEYDGDLAVADYKRYYKESGIVRVKEEDVSFTIIENCASFLYFQVGALTAYMKIGMSYFDQREFKSQQLTETGAGYELKYLAKGWYYLPLEEKPATTDWWKMDHSQRKKIFGPDVDMTVSITQISEGINVRIKTEGCDRVPVRVEIGFTGGAQITSNTFMCEGTPGEAIIAKSGYIEVTKDMDTIIVGPAFANHRFIGGYSGIAGNGSDTYTVYFTDYTSFDHTITLKKG